MSHQWMIQGTQYANCNCAWGCPCQFNSRTTHGHCEAIEAGHIEAGHFGEVRNAGSGQLRGDGVHKRSPLTVAGRPHFQPNRFVSKRMRPHRVHATALGELGIQVDHLLEAGVSASTDE